MKLRKASCIGGMALSMLCLSIGSSYAGLITPIPNFTPYDIGEAPDGYKLQGTLAAGSLSGPGYMVLDPKNQRIAFRFEQAGIGSFVTLPQGTYNFNFGNGACFFYPGFDYAKFKQRFAALTSTPGSTNLLARYTGYVYDSSSCNQPATATFVHAPMGSKGTQGILEMEFAIPTPAVGSTGPICRQGQAYWTATLGTLNTKPSQAELDAAFALPASCNNPIPWCDVVYAPGNPCNVKHSTPNDINT